MSTSKIRVLEVNVDDQGNGGVYSLVKSVIENKPDNVKIDIAALEPFEKQENIEYLKGLGANVYFVGYKGNKLKKQQVIYKRMTSLLKKKKYDVVHIHADVANKLYVSGLAAKKCGVPKIILHAHANGTDGNNRKLKENIHRLCLKKLTGLGAEYAACSYAAAKWMFPYVPKDDVTIVKNGIDLEKYKYDAKTRKAVRESLNIDDEDFLVGHVGRFMYQKNHEYILDVFEDFSKKRKASGKKGRARLLLVGAGELMPEIKKKAKEKNIFDDIIFYGLSDSVNELMQAMDAFVMPSNFEGFGIAALEAQANGMFVLCSDKVPRDVRVTKDIKFLPIEKKDISKWSSLLLNVKQDDRKDNIGLLRDKGFDISDTINQFIGLYTNSEKLVKLTQQGIKEEIFKILCAFADYCDENGLTYALSGGTLLGAVRHKDFIPWDDDVDVFLLRSDYDKLHKLVKKKPIGENYRLESLQNGKLSLPFAKIVDTSTVLDEKYFLHDKHLWIDIFPVDGLPDSKEESDKRIDEVMRLKRYIGWSLARPGTGSTKLRAVARQMAMIVPKIRGARYYSKKIDELAHKDKYETSEYVGAYVWAVSRGERMRKKDFENFCEVEFHGRKFRSPEYDGYLTGLYGDYMTPPPPEKRQGHSYTAFKKI